LFKISIKNKSLKEKERKKRKRNYQLNVNSYFCFKFPEMKKIIFIVCLLCSTTLLAQHKPFQFGFKGGASLGWFGTDVNGYSNNGVEFGGSWGFVADIFLMENYAFTTGFDVLFLNASMTYPYAIEDSIDVPILGQMESKLKAKYIEIPILFTMRTNEIGKLKIYGQIGFGFGILLNAKANNAFTSDNSQTFESDDNVDSDIFRPTRESFIIGAGIEIPLDGSTFIRTGIKYDNAFINVLKGNNTADFNIENDARNNFIELNVSLLF
jgi:hypothetical protein